MRIIILHEKMILKIYDSNIVDIVDLKIWWISLKFNQTIETIILGIYKLNQYKYLWMMIKLWLNIKNDDLNEGEI